MRRRAFVTLLGGTALTWALEARAEPRVWRMGVLETTSLVLNATNFDAFRQGLRDLGYDEGQNLAIEYRSTEAAERFPELAAELVRLKVDLIVLRGLQPSWQLRVPPRPSLLSWYRLPTH